MSVLTAVTAVLLHQSAMDSWNYSGVVNQGRGELAVLPAITAVQLHHSSMDTLI